MWTDAIFGWRQLTKHKAISFAAIVSLGLALGAAVSAFRLIDALLLRPLPIAAPDRLYALVRHTADSTGSPRWYTEFEYPLFERLRDTVRDQADLIAVSSAERRDLTFATDDEMEQAPVQYVSGRMFAVFGLRPALGRLLTDGDDRTPGAHPYAVLSHDYWTRRFGQDPQVIGRTFRLRDRLFEIVGVLEPRFTGTDAGTMTAVFVPMMMQPLVVRTDATWHDTLAVLKPGVRAEALVERMRAPFRGFLVERSRGFVDMPQQRIDTFISERLALEPAPAGFSHLQQQYGPSLWALAALVALVLAIACVNVANLMTAQAGARAKEMAVRVSLGASRARLMRLVLIEGGLIGTLAAIVAVGVAAWASPFVVSLINPPDNPARLVMPFDGRLTAFLFAATVGIVALFASAPALRAAAARPIGVLAASRASAGRQRLMHTLAAVQVAFCLLVLVVAGLFVATFDRLANRPLGFAADRLLVLETVSGLPQSPDLWQQAAAHLRAVPGVERVAVSRFAPLQGTAWNNLIAIDGEPLSNVLTFFNSVSPGWLATMGIPLVDGRDFREGDVDPGGMKASATDAASGADRGRAIGTAIVNQAFARTYFNGASPIGRSFERRGSSRTRFTIVGLIPDVRYGSLREPTLPQAFVPFAARDAQGAWLPTAQGTLMVKTRGDQPAALATLGGLLREEVRRARPELRVSDLRTEEELIRRHAVRERLLALLASFFAVVALLLASVGLYGVLTHAVQQQRRDIGIRMALGARPSHVVYGVAMRVLIAVCAGAIAGLAGGVATARSMTSLFYGVSATDPARLVVPCLTLLLVAAVAALPPLLRAIYLDPVKALRTE